MKDYLSSADVREKVKGIVERSNSDAAFLQQIKDNPVAAFTAAGLSPEAANDLATIQPKGDPSEQVQGYMRCADFTCWTWAGDYASVCPGTCFFITPTG